MTLEEAQEIVSKYGAALASGKDGEFARDKGLLPASRDRIVKAFKLVCAFHIKQTGLSQELGEALINSLVSINLFADKVTYKQVNSNPTQGIQFMVENGRDGELFDEINQFIGKVYELNPNDPLYYQCVYTLANIEYRSNAEDAKPTLFQRLFGRR